MMKGINVKVKYVYRKVIRLYSMLGLYIYLIRSFRYDGQ